MRNGLHRCVGALALLVATSALAGASEANVAAVVGATQSWVTDGDVLSIAPAGDAVYVGGDFTLIGRSTGSWAEVGADGGVRPIRGVVRGEVDAAVPDGRGGWFLLGDIAAVGGVEVKDGELVHLRPTGRLDPAWRLRTDGEVSTVVRALNRLYLGGSFTKVNGEPRLNLAAVDARTGALLDWRPRVTGRTKDDYADVSAIAASADGKVVYVGGSFGRVDGAARRSVAAIGSDGALLPFAPGATYADEKESEDEDFGAASVSLLTLDPRGRVLYLAGDFDQLGGVDRPGLGAVNARSGRVRPWNPDCDGEVYALEIAPAGAPVYVAGEFASVGGKSRRGLAALDARLGTATLWDPGIGGAVHAIALDTRRHLVHAGGEFEAVGDADRANLAAVDTRTGKAVGADTPVVGAVDVVERTAGGGIAVGGDFVSVGAARRDGLAALSADGATVATWKPGLRGLVRALAADPRGGRVYVGGRFSIGESRTQRSLATIELGSGTIAPWGPNANSGVWAIAPSADGETAYLGGAFTTIDAKARRRLAAVRAVDGVLLPWASGASAVVRSLSLGAEELWVGGQFTTIGGEPRRGVAAVELDTGRATGWEATANGNVEAVVQVGEVVYVAGPFTAIGGRSRKHLAALDAVDGSATRWDPAPDDVVRAIAVTADGAQMVIGGDFERVGGGRRDVASFDLATGFVSDWRPIAPFPAYALAFGVGTTLFVGGEGAVMVFPWPPAL